MEPKVKKYTKISAYVPISQTSGLATRMSPAKSSVKLREWQCSSSSCLIKIRGHPETLHNTMRNKIHSI